MNTTIGVITAMPVEAKMVLAGRAWRREAVVPCPSDPRYLVTCAGIGQENARRAAESMISRGVSGLISIGLAGGLDPALKAGQVVVATDVLRIPPEGPPDAWPLRGRDIDAGCAALATAGLTALAGKIVTVDQAVTDPQDKERLYQRSGALAVDMESAAVARIAAASNLPCFGLRVICDTAAMAVPREMVASLRPDGGIRLPAVLSGMARRPALLPELLQMARVFKRARCALGQAWNGLLAAPGTRILE